MAGFGGALKNMGIGMQSREGRAWVHSVDRACIDAVKASPDHGKIHLEERMASRHATHVLDYAEQLGMGTQKYVLITIE